MEDNPVARQSEYVRGCSEQAAHLGGVCMIEYVSLPIHMFKQAIIY